jgi:hypothetical protein
MWSEARGFRGRVRRPRLRRQGPGWAAAAPGFFVWQESWLEAEGWARELDRQAGPARPATPSPSGSEPRRSQS